MRLKLLFSIICLIALMVELSFDSTNAFVRITASQTVSSLVVVVDPSASMCHSTTNHSSSSDHQKNHESKPPKHIVVYSMGHYSGPATSFTHFVPQAVKRIDHQYVWDYGGIDHSLLLRPPISTSSLARS